MSPNHSYNYVVAGLTIRSEIMLPELRRYNPITIRPDIEIRRCPVPNILAHSTEPTSGVVVAKNDVLLRILGVGRYLVKSGRSIWVEPESKVEEKDLRLFVLGSAFGAILLQRRLFPLHASVVIMNDDAVAFTGDSGAGKSTIAAWMHRQGYPLLSDDVCVIHFDDSGAPWAFPGFPRLKLWDDALQFLNIETEKLQQDHFRADKYHMPVADNFCTGPVPLKHITVLQYSDIDSAPRIDPVKPARMVPVLRDNTYRHQYIDAMGLTKNHFKHCARLAGITQSHILLRPRQHEAMAECQRLIEQRML